MPPAADATPPPRILALAGANGAGKSSVGGAFLRETGGAYFNPDEIARGMRSADPSLDVAAANGRAWAAGRRLLENAIRGRHDFALETTLGGRTIPGLLAAAADTGFEVRVWYAGLATPELHLARVAARVRHGGHDIPEHDIRRRFDDSRRNLVLLLPRLAELLVYDNSAEADPALGATPRPLLVLHVRRGRIIGPPILARTPAWARPIVAASRKLAR
ncbi:MAG: zeta toxin family protein [Deltaproteobacteria bacterium]|nr:zeta toxin family protein [Deltaproteobacteria bacterium]